MLEFLVMNKLIIFDFNRTLYNPQTGALFPEVLSCLNSLNQMATLGIITTTSPGRDRNLFRRLGILPYFRFIKIIKQKNISNFRFICSEFNSSPENSYIVGDRLDEEIAFGNQLGFKTIWLCHSKNQLTDKYCPRYTIRSLSELSDIIEREDSDCN